MWAGVDVGRRKRAFQVMGTGRLQPRGGKGRTGKLLEISHVAFPLCILSALPYGSINSY